MKILLLILSAATLSFAKPPTQPKKTTAAPAATQAPAATTQAPEASHKPMVTKKAYQRPYGMAGCGLGSVIIPRQGSQVLAGTTNGTLANQMFGITSGTLNCLEDASSEVASKMDTYIHGNKSQLEGDVAKGNGETIVALSQVMGCSETAQLGKTLKANYQNIFVGDVNTDIVTDNIITVIQNDDQLSQQCKLTI